MAVRRQIERGLLPPAAAHPGALVRIFSARTVSWRGSVATHSWIVVKPVGAAAYRRFDYGSGITECAPHMS